MTRAVILFLMAFLWPFCVVAQEFGALARVVPEGSTVNDGWFGRASVDLQLSGGVPWRAFTLKEPDRVVVDFREVDFAALDLAAFDQSEAIAAVHAGPLRAGWSRMVLELVKPMGLHQAVLSTGEAAATLRLDLRPLDRAAFDAATGAPLDAAWQEEAPLVVPTPLVGSDMAVVVIDPGHGGIDPGAIRQGYEEADLVLQLALELEEALLRDGRFKTILTRRDDSFVSLERRVAITAQAGADAFISLHADAVEAGVAQGAAVFTLGETAADAASQALVERHERSDLLAGLDLSGADDEVAQVLLDLARQDGAQRSKMLAEAVVEGFRSNDISLHKKPLQQAAFSVLKSADVPSILVEAGFLSTDAELERLKDPVWRAHVALGIRDGLETWLLEDQALAPLRRQ